MELNWDAFLNSEGFDIPNNQWSDLTTCPSAPSTFEMPNSAATKSSEPASEDINELDPSLIDVSADPYFVDDDQFITNDYFPGGVDFSYPFNDIMDSCEVTDSTAKFSSTPDGTNRASTQLKPRYPLAIQDQSPQIQSSLRQAVNRANTLRSSESAYSSDDNNAVFNEETDADGLKALHRPPQPTPQRTRAPESTTSKRNRNKNVPDIISACWTSPLCPNHDQNGVPPNPSTCGAGCAPFLFANDDALLDLDTMYNEAQHLAPVDGIVDIQSRSRKRSDSSTSIHEPSGRSFSNPSTSPADNGQRTKNEEDNLHVEESDDVGVHQQPTSRRRVPHHQVERKYRDSLNTQLESLRRVVPSLQQQRVCDGADIEDLSAPAKPSKAVILSSATAYIKQVETEKKNLADQNRLLRTRVKALQALVKCDDCSLMQYVMDLKID